MIVNHHIAAQLARGRQCDLLDAADAVRGDVAPAADGAGSSSGTVSAPHDGRLILRSWRARRSAAGEAPTETAHSGSGAPRRPPRP
jgi:hypothetical protein